MKAEANVIASSIMMGFGVLGVAVAKPPGPGAEGLGLGFFLGLGLFLAGGGLFVLTQTGRLRDVYRSLGIKDNDSDSATHS